jgi:hypothetical protein
VSALRIADDADPTTTGIYDRRRRKVTRTILERISICATETWCALRYE